MTTQGRTIQEIVQATSDSDGHTLAAVRCSDQTLGITRDGVLIESLRWQTNELNECLAFLERFARTSQFDAPPTNVTNS